MDLTQKGQSSIMDALFFLTIVVILASMMQLFSVGYGDLTREQISRQYLSIYATSAVQTLLFSSAVRTGQDQEGNPLDLGNSREVDYLLADLKEDFSDDCTLTARSRLSMLDELKLIMSGLGSGFDYIFYVYVPESGTINQGVEECPDYSKYVLGDPPPVPTIGQDNRSEKNILTILKATPRIIGPGRFQVDDPSTPQNEAFASPCPSGEGVCVKTLDGTFITIDDPASLGEEHLYFICSPKLVTTIESGLLLNRIGDITAPQSTRISLHRIDEKLQSSRMQAIANLAVWPAASVLQSSDAGQPDEFFSSEEMLNCCSAGTLRKRLQSLTEPGPAGSVLSAIQIEGNLLNDPEIGRCLR